MNIKVPLRVLESPYRDISMPLIKYIKKHRAEHGSEVVTVYTPHYIVGHWWETFLHNHKARRIRHKLALVHGVVIALVPWLLDSSTLIYGRRSRPLPGQDRRGEPVRPVLRKPMPPARAAKKPTPAVSADDRARRPRGLVGGLVGTGLRLGIDALLPHGDDGFPLSTLLINVAGSFALGMLVEPGLAGGAGVAARGPRHRPARIVHDLLGGGRLRVHPQPASRRPVSRSATS